MCVKTKCVRIAISVNKSISCFFFIIQAKEMTSYIFNHLKICDFNINRLDFKGKGIEFFSAENFKFVSYFLPNICFNFILRTQRFSSFLWGCFYFASKFILKVTFKLFGIKLLSVWDPIDWILLFYYIIAVQNWWEYSF